jgi:hypothetical protein
MTSSVHDDGHRRQAAADQAQLWTRERLPRLWITLAGAEEVTVGTRIAAALAERCREILAIVSPT